MADCSGAQYTYISTLSNWWTRNMPLVSLPAAPASRRKFVLNAAYLAGSWSSSSRSSVWMPASATSEVPVRYRLSRSRW